MKLKPQIDIQEFLQAVQNCRGGVWFHTENGDQLDLRSTLSQLLFASIVAKSPLGPVGEIRVKKREDLSLLGQYLTK